MKIAEIRRRRRALELKIYIDAIRAKLLSIEGDLRKIDIIAAELLEGVIGHVGVRGKNGS